MFERKRYHQVNLEMQRNRRQVEAILLAALVTAFAALWRSIYTKLRDHRYGEIDSALDLWEDDFEEDYGGALVTASEVLATDGIEAGEIAAAFEQGTAANVGAGKGPARMIGENIREGIKREIAKPNRTDEETQRAVKRWMDERRAKVISQTDATNLQSETTQIEMRNEGLGFWVWQTLYGTGELDEKVCAECEDLNGRTFAATDDMPPKHHACRCFPVPLKEYLRGHDQPFFGIHERLQARG